MVKILLSCMDLILSLEFPGHFRLQLCNPRKMYVQLPNESGPLEQSLLLTQSEFLKLKLDSVLQWLCA